jgi:hypothetical protein
MILASSHLVSSLSLDQTHRLRLGRSRLWIFLLRRHLHWTREKRVCRLKIMAQEAVVVLGYRRSEKMVFLVGGYHEYALVRRRRWMLEAVAIRCPLQMGSMVLWESLYSEILIENWARRKRHPMVGGYRVAHSGPKARERLGLRKRMDNRRAGQATLCGSLLDSASQNRDEDLCEVLGNGRVCRQFLFAMRLEAESLAGTPRLRLEDFRQDL